MNRSIESRTIPQPKPTPIDSESIINAFAHRMMYEVARDQYTATDYDAFLALAFSVRDRLMERWFATQQAYYRSDAKRVYYLSLEFLLGRLLISNIINLGAMDQYTAAMQRLGLTLEQMAEQSDEAGLGNGGLGRLAACFLDSAATLALPFFGYGIRYEFGIFRQHINNGEQVEAPDAWLRYGNPWEIPRADILFPVRFYGRSEPYVDEQGRPRARWVETQDVYAMAYDILIPGYRNDTVNMLRLWAAKSSREFDLAKFNAGAYVAAVEDKYNTENISKVLYPPDDQYAGRELRLKQQYFFTSATIQDVVRRFRKRAHQHGRDGSVRWEDLPEKVAIQLNDTHPAIAIPEMMRMLVDEEHLEWEPAWSICQRLFGYTNHTVLPEALESWPGELMKSLLPRHFQIIEEIDQRFRESVSRKYPGDDKRLAAMAVIHQGTGQVRMANLAIVGSHTVNGVARLHTEILKSRVFPEFHELYPGKFTSKTNGVTPRRWLLKANPELSQLITEAIGDGWVRNLERLRELERFANDPAFQERWKAIKGQRKRALAGWLAGAHQIQVDTESLFDVQIKRIHEYKRQLLNVLHVIALYHRLLAGEEAGPPRTVILGGKAAPSYQVAKMIITLIHRVAAMVEQEPRASGRLSVRFVPNYDVSAAEMLFPATDLSEQISTAGMEASGTGNMKAVLNGAVIIGTLDGANIEIREEVGAENMFIFGLTADETAALRERGYDPRACMDRSPELQRVVQTLAGLDGGRFREIADVLGSTDRYFHCADFDSYLEAHRRAGQVWTSPPDWIRMSILNTARSGRFSSDRTVAEYAREIWRVEPVPVSLP